MSRDPLDGSNIHQDLARNGATPGLLLVFAQAKPRLETLVIRMGHIDLGRELLEKHDVQDQRGPFVAVNCAAVPTQIAERLFFGAKRGAYSGAESDAEGYIGAAHGGTLFLDEVGELDPSVQAKLLRVLETREVLPLGAARPRTVDFGLVSATHADLHALVGTAKFRADLYFRIGRPSVKLPALRERREDIPWLVARAVAAAGNLKAHVSLVEAALLRRWLGNVRELLTDVKVAADAARAAEADAVRARDLPLAPELATGSVSDEDGSDDRSEAPSRDVTRDQIETALRAERGNISGAARALGLHRTQLRRLLARFSIDARQYGPHQT
jgi:transcriptional regulator with PAS, ATPase and Fis domain